MLAERLLEVRERIRKAGGKDVKLIAATKGCSLTELEEALSLGLVDFGENYAQQLVSRSEMLSSKIPPSKIRWHFIGQLQTNKVKDLAGIRIELFQSVDRARLIDALARHFPGTEILIQLETTADPNRGGVGPKEIPDLVGLADAAGLKPVGIMLIARQGTKESIEDFRLAKQLQMDLGLRELSAGMSQDFEAAVGEGSTMVRLGSALFSP